MSEPKLYVFRLYPDHDKDLMDWLDSFPLGQRAFHIRRILRQAHRQDTRPQAVDYDQIRAAVKAAVLEALEESHPRQMVDIKAAVSDAVEKALARLIQPEEPRKRWPW